MNRKKTLLIFVTCIVLVQAALIIVLVGYFNDRNIAIQQERTAGLNESRLQLASTSINSFFEGRQQALELLAANPLIGANSANECQQNIIEVAKKANNFDTLSRLNADGIFDCAGLPTTVGVDGRGIGQYLNDILDDQDHKTVLSDPFNRDGVTFLAMHVPRFDSNGVFLGTLGSAIFLDEFDEEFIDPLIEADLNHDVLVMNQQGVIVSYNKNNNVNAQSIFEVDFGSVSTKVLDFAKQVVEADGALSSKIVGNTALSLQRSNPIDGQNWYLISASKIDNDLGITDFFSSGTGNFSNGALFLVALSTAANVLLVFYFNRSIFKPLAGINETMRTFRMGSRNVRIETNLDYHDDIGKISRTFNSLAEEISDYEHSLEQKIKVATKTLKKQKSQLELDKERDDALIASIGEGIAVTDSYGNITRVNSALLRLFITKEKDVLKKPLFDTLHLLDKDGKPIKPQDHPAYTAIIEGKAVSARCMVDKKDKAAIFLDVVAAPYLVEGKPSGTVVVYRDATFDEEIDKAKSEFVSLASHQLRTPLTTIGWYLEILKSGDAGKLTKEQKEHIQTVYDANTRLSTLVSSLLNVSRIDMGTFRITPTKNDISEILSNVILELKGLISKKKLSVNTKFGTGAKIYMSDKQLIYIILQNLLSNAVKYTPANGKVSVQFKKVKSKYVITVTDSGYGIPAKDADKIFSKLYRASNVLTKDTDGTGLGLYTVKAIVEEAGGNVSFKSIEDKGTTFTIKLPARGMNKRTGTRVLDSAS